MTARSGRRRGRIDGSIRSRGRERGGEGPFPPTAPRPHRLPVSPRRDGTLTDLPLKMTLIVPRAILPFEVLGGVNLQAATPDATLPLAGRAFVPTCTAHLTVPDGMPAPLSSRTTRCTDDDELACLRLRRNRERPCPAFSVTGSSLSRLSVGEEQPRSSPLALPSPSSSLPFRALRERHRSRCTSPPSGAIVLADQRVGGVEVHHQDREPEPVGHPRGRHD